MKYLGVRTKRLQLTDYDPLINRIVSRIQSWTARKLSYAGRTLLISTVLLSIQRFWSQTFPLPQGVILSQAWSGS